MEVKNCEACKNLFSSVRGESVCEACNPPVIAPVEGERLLSQINESRTAHVFTEWVKPIFDEEARELIESMKTNFRSGKYTELLLASHVAQLCVLDNLKARIASLAAKGDAAAKELGGK